MAFSLRCVGEIGYNKVQLIGKGEIASVYKGTFERRDVAVKKIFCGTNKEFERWDNEVKILLDCDSHDNIVKYHKKEKDDDFIYIALELCEGNLQQWMENKLVSISTDAISNIEILHQATKGIHHLHEKRIIHRDLKPQNILLVRLNALEIRVKIADFGISRAIPDERTSVTLTTTGMAAIGWRSPEILNFESGTPTAIKRLSTATDIFSLGCIFYYILTNGMHPFGQNPVDQEFNIKNYCNISTDHLPPLLIGNKWLIDNMIVRDPKARPNVKTIISHYIFWKSDKTLEFMAHISDVLFDYKQDEKIIQLGNDIESYYDVVAPNCHPRFGNPDGWLQMTCPIVRQYLCENRERTYHGRTLYQLIRTIRNLKGHHGSLAAKWLQVQYTLGSLPCGFVNYWMSRFPFLLPTLWHLCQSLLQASNDAYDVKRFYTCE